MKAFSLPAAVLLVVLTAGESFACTCIPAANPFLKVAPKSVPVVRARVLRHTVDGETKTEMDVEVLETLAGETAKSVVSVSGDPDTDDDERRDEKQEVPLKELRRRFAPSKKSVCSAAPESNNAMQSTANSVAFKRKTCG